MRTLDKKIACNLVLLLVLIALSAITAEYRLLHEGLLSGEANNAGTTRSRANTLTHNLYAFIARQQTFLAGDGQHSCVTLPYFPLNEEPEEDSAVTTPTAVVPTGVVGNLPAAHPPPSAPYLPPTPLHAIRLRSSIVLKENALLEASQEAVAWEVQTEWLRRTPLSASHTATTITTAATVTTTTTTTTTTTSALPTLPADESSALSTVEEKAPPKQNEKDGAGPPVGTSEGLRHANAVILLMSPTFSSEVSPEAKEVDPANPTTAADARETLPTTQATATTNALAPMLRRCPRCQKFLEGLLPSLEEAFLRRHAYPVHILHRGPMPVEVEQYIVATLPSATRITIEDVAAVLSERVTETSAVVLEPWLKEMGADLHYRRRFTTAAPVPTTVPATTVPSEEPDVGDGDGGEAPSVTVSVGDDAVARENLGGGGRGGLAGRREKPTPNPYDEAAGVTQALRERWELRRFWTGSLSLLPSLQPYDFFWFIDSQSFFTKPLARDVLADVVNHTCATAYHKLVYLTHKRVTDLWDTILAWNAQSAGAYFSADELQRALEWLSDEQASYSGKVYASDCFVMSFAVTRHPVYLDFFHWIDGRAPYGLMRQQWSPMMIYTVFAELLMEKHGWDSCLLDPFSGFRTS